MDLKALFQVLFEPTDLVEIRPIKFPQAVPAAQRWIQAGDIERHLPWVSQLSESVKRRRGSGGDKAPCLSFGINPRKEKGGGGNGAVACVRSLRADFDKMEVDAALAMATAVKLPEPTATVASGGGLHAYWRLAPGADPEPGAVLQKRFLQLFHDHAAGVVAMEEGASGLDKAVDIARVLRLPGTWNLKDPAAPKRCKILSIGGRRYELETFEAILPPLPERAPPPPPAPRPVDDRDVDERLQQYMATIPGVAEGGRNAEAFRVAALLLVDWGLAPDSAWPWLHEWNLKNTPPLPEIELRTTLRSAQSSASGTPGRLRDAPAPERARAHAKAESAPPAPPVDPEHMPEPMPLDDLGLPPVQPCQERFFPPALRDWCLDVAERMQCPADYTLAASYVFAGALLGRRLGIHPMQNDPWLAIPNMWGVCIGSPGAGKSPQVEALWFPIQELEAKAAEEWRAEMPRYNALLEVYKQRQAAENKRAAREGCEPCVYDEPVKPVCRRHRVCDSTYAKTQDLLAENPHGLLVYQDELAGVVATMQSKGNEQMRGFYLSGWGGNGTHPVDRVSREGKPLPAYAVSLFGTTQPGCWAGIVRDSKDGFVERFQMAVYPDVPTEYRHIDQSPDRAAEDRFGKCLRGLVTVDPGLYQAEPGDVPGVRFTGAAQEAFNAWNLANMRAVRMLGDDVMANVLSKYRSLVPSVALLFHVCGGGFGPVGEEAVSVAIDVAAYLKSHTNRIHALGTVAPVHDGALALRRLIEEGALSEPFTAYEIATRGRSRLKTKEDVTAAARFLVDRNWLYEVPDPAGKSGRPTVHFGINPKALCV